MRAVLAVLALAGAFALAGCGDSGGGDTGADPGDGGDDTSAVEPGGGDTDATVDQAEDAADGDPDAPSETGADDAGPTEDAGPDEDAEDLGPCGECPPQTHCNEDNGACTPDLCTKGAVTCSDLETVKTCDEEGASFEETPCPEGHTCYGGICHEPVCEPGETGVCDGNAVLKCNSLGIDWVPFPCPGGHECKDSECVPVPPNVILLVDTSGSMNWIDDVTDPTNCVGADCPPWSLPTCDDTEDPKTRLGKVKKALRTVIDSGALDGMEVALQRFPQRPFTSDPFLGLVTPECVGGYWTFNQSSTISGDNNAKITPASGWFTSNLGEILAVPFRSQGTELAKIHEWVDGVEAVSPSGSTCGSATQCNGGACVNSSCYAFDNPELRAIHGTPLGKSLFYAGEYLRHRVLVQGKACFSDSDCGTPHHTCVDGACYDPNAYCRPNVVIAFTDGEDTQNTSVEDFFHPRVQAKRMHYGLGCGVDADCLSGATCEGNLCRPPEGVVDETQLACETGGVSCVTTADCPDPCAGFGGCQGQCLPAEVTVSEGGLADTVKDSSGIPVPVTVHVVDASGVAGKNQLIAAYGGGQHFSVESADPAAIVTAVETLIGDTKSDILCGGAD